MATFYESDLTFTFPDDWVVRKFDKTVAYQSLSGHGLKGVDFICLEGEAALWLVEAKNFRRRDQRYRAVRRRPAALAGQVATKFADSQRLINIVYRSLQRRWSTRFLLWWYHFHLRPRPTKTYWFWAEAERRLREGNLYCVLWLETPETAPDYVEATRSVLRELLPSATRLLVNTGTSPLPFTATGEKRRP